VISTTVVKWLQMVSGSALKENRGTVHYLFGIASLAW